MLLLQPCTQEEISDGSADGKHTNRPPPPATRENKKDISRQLVDKDSAGEIREVGHRKTKKKQTAFNADRQQTDSSTTNNDALPPLFFFKVQINKKIALQSASFILLSGGSQSQPQGLAPGLLQLIVNNTTAWGPRKGLFNKIPHNKKKKEEESLGTANGAALRD